MPRSVFFFRFFEVKLNLLQTLQDPSPNGCGDLESNCI